MAFCNLMAAMNPEPTQRIRKLLGKSYRLTDHDQIRSIWKYKHQEGIIDNTRQYNPQLDDAKARLEIQYWAGATPEAALRKLFGFRPMRFKPDPNRGTDYRWFFGYRDVIFAISVFDDASSLRVLTNFNAVENKRGRIVISQFLNEMFSAL